jgi:hypothetical protein
VPDLCTQTLDDGLGVPPGANTANRLCGRLRQPRFGDVGTSRQHRRTRRASHNQRPGHARCNVAQMANGVHSDTSNRPAMASLKLGQPLGTECGAGRSRHQPNFSADMRDAAIPQEPWFSCPGAPSHGDEFRQRVNRHGAVDRSWAIDCGCSDWREALKGIETYSLQQWNRVECVGSRQRRISIRGYRAAASAAIASRRYGFYDRWLAYSTGPFGKKQPRETIRVSTGGAPAGTLIVLLGYGCSAP